MSAPAAIRLLRWTVIVAVAAAALGGLTVSGPPRQERSRQLDERRRADLQSLADRIDEYWNRKKALPPALDGLIEAGDRFATPVPHDPLNEAAYEYAPVDSVRYTLCATFETDSQEMAHRQSPGYPDPIETFWNHPAGHHCYTIRVRRHEPTRPPGD